MRLKKIGKKGYAYLLIASILIAIVLIVFLTVQRYQYQDRQDIEEIRIKTINDFVKGFNDDVERATYISAFRTLLALEDNIANTGSFFNDTETQFRETFYYGIIDNSTPDIMRNSSFKDYLANVNNIANNMGINTSVNITSINLEHSDPWTIKVNIKANITITDQNKLVTWNYFKSFNSDLPIENLRDPLYSTFTGGRSPNIVTKNPYSELVNNTNNDTNNLIQLINKSYYVASVDAPNFLMRFENDYSTDPEGNGIESIVNIEELSNQEIEVFTDRIKIDYIYFNDLSSSKVCNVETIPLQYHFTIPQNRASRYEVDEINYSTTCP